VKTDRALTAERVRTLLDYDPASGSLTWRASGRVGGYSSGKRGRIQIEIDGLPRYAHRVAWLHVHGIWPTGQIDHINGDHRDNRLVNLRELPGTASNKQNQHRGYRNNTSGLLGVSHDHRSGNYRARIMVAGKSRNLGTFATAEAASEAYLTAKRELHPYWQETA
jgi:hypothetical protein